MKREERKEIEREFKKYKENKKNADGYVVRHAYDGIGIDISQPRVKTSATNVTEKKTVKLVQEALRLVQWCRVYELTFYKYRFDKKGELMQMKYEKNYSMPRICMDIGISRATYFRWLDEVLGTAYQWARAQKIFEKR